MRSTFAQPPGTVFGISRQAAIFGLALTLVSTSLGFALAAFAPWFRGAEAPLTSNFIGNDFNAFLAAARLALIDPVSAYDIDQLTAAVSDQLGRTIRYSWAYPPTFFFYLVPLAAFPLLPALLLWWLATTGGLMAAVFATTRNGWIALAVLLFPPTIVNLMMGQNGSLSALILLLGLAALAQRPVLAGAIWALLAYKPHLALLLPIGLIAARQWRALLSMCVAGGFMAGLSLLVFGWQSWMAFFLHLPDHASYVLNGTLNWKRIPTPLVAVYHVTGNLTLATLAQSFSIICALAGSAWVWWRTEDSATRSLAIAAGSFLASPYAFDYDFTLLAVPATFLAVEIMRGRSRPAVAPLLAMAWLAPYVSWIGAEALNFPIGLSIVVALFSATLLRAYCLADKNHAMQRAET